MSGGVHTPSPAAAQANILTTQARVIQYLWREEGTCPVCDAPQAGLLLAQVPQGIHMPPCQPALSHLQHLCQPRDVRCSLLVLPSILYTAERFCQPFQPFTADKSTGDKRKYEENKDITSRRHVDCVRHETCKKELLSAWQRGMLVVQVSNRRYWHQSIPRNGASLP